MLIYWTLISQLQDLSVRNYTSRGQLLNKLYSMEGNVSSALYSSFRFLTQHI